MWAAITKYCRLGGLNNKDLFLTVLEVGKYKIKVLLEFDSEESPLPGQQRATFLLCPHIADRSVFSSSFMGTNLIMEAPLA